MIIRKTSNLCITKCCKEKHVDLLLIGEEEKRHYVLIKDHMIILYITEENIFVIIFYKLLVQRKLEKAIPKTALRLMANNRLHCLKKMNMLNSKIMREK